MLLLLFFATSLCGTDYDPTRVAACDIGGFARGLTISGNIAFLAAETQGLYIIDVNDPLSPKQLAQHSTANARDVKVQADVAYIADGQAGLTIIDVSDPTHPHTIASYNADAPVSGLQIRDSIAYLAASSRGLILVDVANPALPKRIGVFDTAGTAQAVFLKGEHAYVNDGAGGLLTIDVRDPSHPIQLGAAPTGGSDRFTLVGNTAYIALGGSGLDIFDLTEPRSPRLLGHYSTSNVRDVTVVGGVAYLANDQNGVLLLDVSDPAHLRRVGWYKTRGSANSLTLRDSLLYVADGAAGLDIIDVAVQAYPQRTDDYGAIGPARAIDVSGSILYVLGYSSGLHIIDTSDPAGLIPVGRYPLIDGSDAAVLGTTAYVTRGVMGIDIVNLAEPAQPTRAGWIYPGGTPSGIVVRDDLAYVAIGHSGIIIINVTDASEPRKLGGYDTKGVVNRLALSGHVLCVADEDFYDELQRRVPGDGLVILDVSNPLSPKRLGAYDCISNPRNVTVYRDLAYVVGARNTGSNSVGHLEIVDVADSYEPRLLGSCDTGRFTGTAIDVWIQQQTAYVANGKEGVQVVDVSDPTRPRRVTGNPSFEAVAVVGRGCELFLATFSDGLAVCELAGFSELPKLTLSGLQLEWNEAAVGGRLQMTTNIDGGTWRDLSGFETTNRATLQMSGDQEYYRLVKP